MTDDVLAGWEQATFSGGGLTRPTYRRGSGPGVVVIHEIPGITPAVAAFANEVVDAGFTVVMPSLVGAPGRADLNLSPADLAKVRELAADGCGVMGLRFDRDKLVGTRFDTLGRELGDNFVAVEFPSVKGNDHSVVTEQRVEEGVQRVLDFFRAKLTTD